MTAPVSTLPPDFADLGFGLNAQRRVLLVADMVESVRLMQRHEWETTQRWRSLVQTLVQDVLPAHQGTLVQRRGDGLMLEFETVTGAAAAAFECHRRADAANQGRPGDQHIVLRMGLHQAEVLADGIDLYGAGVQLTHRLAALAQPGETLCTAEVRDELTDGLHASVCDKGERLLPGQADPVRVYQLQPVGDAPRNLLRWAPESLLPRVAFVAAQSYVNPEEQAVSQIVVTELTAAASRINQWRVISAQSTLRFVMSDWKQVPIPSINEMADYFVSVRLERRGELPRIVLDCSEKCRGEKIWQEFIEAPHIAWLSETDGISIHIMQSLASALIARSIELSHQCALHSLPGYSLLLSAMHKAHRTSERETHLAIKILDYLSHRHPRSCEVKYWLATSLFHSYLYSTDRVKPSIAPVNNALCEALDNDPDHSASATLYTHISALTSKDGSDYLGKFEELTTKHPNEPLAWLYFSSHIDEPTTRSSSIDLAKIAVMLSPQDIQQYIKYTVLCKAYLVHGDLASAVDCGRQSVNLNSTHAPGLMMLIAALVCNDQLDEARQFAEQFVRLRPNASVDVIRRRYPRPNSTFIKLISESLRIAGIPN